MLLSGDIHPCPGPHHAMSTPSETEFLLPVDIHPCTAPYHVGSDATRHTEMAQRDGELHPRPAPYHAGSDATRHTEVAQWDGELPAVCTGSEAEASGAGGSHGVPRACPPIGHLDRGLVRSHGERNDFSIGSKTSQTSLSSANNSNSKSKNRTVATVTHVNKLLNPRIVKNRKWAIFRTVNHSRTGTLQQSQKDY